MKKKDMVGDNRKTFALTSAAKSAYCCMSTVVRAEDRSSEIRQALSSWAAGQSGNTPVLVLQEFQLLGLVAGDTELKINA